MAKYRAEVSRVVTQTVEIIVEVADEATDKQRDIAICGAALRLDEAEWKTESEDSVRVDDLEELSTESASASVPRAVFKVEDLDPV